MLVLQNKPSSKDTRGDKSHFKRTKREKQQNKIAHTFCLQNCSIQIVNGVFFIEYCVFKYFLAIIKKKQTKNSISSLISSLVGYIKQKEM